MGQETRESKWTSSSICRILKIQYWDMRDSRKNDENKNKTMFS
jgi:hypothetical protein